MLSANSCRLCFTCDNSDDYLNIFGITGDGLRIHDVNKILTFTHEMNATLIEDSESFLFHHNID